MKAKIKTKNFLSLKEVVKDFSDEYFNSERTWVGERYNFEILLKEGLHREGHTITELDSENIPYLQFFYSLKLSDIISNLAKKGSTRDVFLNFFTEQDLDDLNKAVLLQSFFMWIKKIVKEYSVDVVENDL